MPEPELTLTLRPPEEIQAAHDRLVAIILGEVPSPFQNRHAMTMLQESAAVLCWVLNHDHNRSFEENLQKIDEYHRACGLELVNSGKLQRRGEDAR